MLFPFPSLTSSLIPTSTMHTNPASRSKKERKKKQALNCYQYPASFFPRSSLFPDYSRTEVGRKGCTSHPTLPTPSSSTDQTKKWNQHELRLEHIFRAHRLPPSRCPPKTSILKKGTSIPKARSGEKTEKLLFRREQQMSPRMLPSRLPAPAPARNPPQIR
jgi:hypothetical protein